jgi:hypothetical protein
MQLLHGSHILWLHCVQEGDPSSSLLCFFVRGLWLTFLNRLHRKSPCPACTSVLPTACLPGEDTRNYNTACCLFVTKEKTLFFSIPVRILFCPCISPSRGLSCHIDSPSGCSCWHDGWTLDVRHASVRNWLEQVSVCPSVRGVVRIEELLLTRVYPKVSGLAAWSEICKWYSSLPLGVVVSLFLSQSSEFCRRNLLYCFSTSVCRCCKHIFRYLLSLKAFGYPFVYCQNFHWLISSLLPRPHRLWSPPSLLSNGYQDLLLGSKEVGAWSWPFTFI